MKSFKVASFLMILMAVMFLATTSAHTNIMISLKHQLLMEQPSGSETVVTFKIRVKNTGSSDISDLKLLYEGPIATAPPGAQPLSLGYLPADAEITEILEIPLKPTEQMTSAMAGYILFRASGLDNEGNLFSYEASSEGVAK